MIQHTQDVPPVKNPGRIWFDASFSVDNIYEGPVPNHLGTVQEIAPPLYGARYIYLLAGRVDGVPGLRPLYVGKACSPRNRLDRHRHKPWWPDASALVLFLHEFEGWRTVEHEIDELEREAIADFKPYYNISRPLPWRDKGGIPSWR